MSAVDRSSVAPRLAAASPWLTLAPASVLMTVAFWYAESESGTLVHFHLFWGAALLFALPASIRLLSADAVVSERVALVATLGLFTFLPKYLRTPTGPLYHDEFAHWRQVEAIVGDGRVFHPNPTIDIIEYFPGLHTLTAALRELTGLSTFATGTIVLAVLHSAALVGVFLLADAVLRSSRLAGLAALVFALNPNFMYFDSQFSYESLAIVFFVWTLAAAARLPGSTTRRERVGWLVLGLISGCACVATHHITAFVLVFVLALIVLASFLRREDRLSMPALAALVTGIAVAVGTCLALVGPQVLSYLSPHVAGGIEQAIKVLDAERSGRRLFGHTVNTTYERAAAFLAPVLVLCLVATTMWRARVQSSRATFTALVVLGLVYFPSLPLILTQAGAEGARRSWTFSYLGIGLLVAPALVWFSSRPRSPWARHGTTAAVAAVLAVILVGNVAAGLNPEYRFPGPYVYGSDARSMTPELIAATRWLRRTYGPNLKVIGDRDSSLALASFGHEWTGRPSDGFPFWTLYFDEGEPPQFLIHELRTSDYRYMMIDKRMSTHLPGVGVYFAPGEPLMYSRTVPLPAAALEKYERLPWTIKVFESDNFEIYRFDFSQFRRADAGTQE
jgi:hypothetical protein